jgi:hypothetical protein
MHKRFVTILAGPPGAASTLGLSLHPREASLQTGENAPGTKFCGIWRIRARETAADVVKKIGAWILGPKSSGSPGELVSNHLSAIAGSCHYAVAIAICH